MLMTGEKGSQSRGYIDGQKSDEGRAEQTEPMLFSADETGDDGAEFGLPVSEDYGSRGKEFSGEVNWVEIDLGDDAVDADRFINHEERLSLPMALQ